MNVESLAVGSVYPKRNGRPVDRKMVGRIAASIDAIGLQTPITVTPCKRTAGGKEVDAYEIVAGRHRYEAALSLKWSHIKAVVQPWDADDASLWEIDENLMRAELTDAQRADHHARREAIMVRKGLVVPGTRGGDRTKRQNVVSYAEQSAAALGVDKRTIQRDLARGKKIAPEVLAEVSGTDLDKGVVLDRLAATPTSQQASVLAAIRQERSRVPLAKPPLNDAEASERQLGALMAAWNKAGPDARERFLEKVGR